MKKAEWLKTIGCYCAFDFSTGDLTIFTAASIVKMAKEAPLCMVVGIQKDRILVSSGNHFIAEVSKQHVKVL